ncbi:MAG TPA: hypothetical protein VGW10_10440, partial [Solirubrobacteraceae bacterium]|nr:hypothetical protein [Solirubrobacteraceae bacterium]
APTRANRRRPRCTRLKRVGLLSRQSPAGASRVRFTGRVRGKALRPRPYRMLVRATDAAGNRSRSRTLRFRIVRR